MKKIFFTTLILMSTSVLNAKNTECDINVDELYKQGFSQQEVLDICEQSKLNNEERQALASSTYRKGFFIAFGLGLHQTTKSGINNSSDYSGLRTSLNIGYGITNDLLLFYSNNVNWYSSETQENYYGDNSETSTQAIGLTGIGIRYFTPQNFYFIFVYGVTAHRNLDTPEDNYNGNNGYEIGLGYELTENVSSEISYTHLNFLDFETESFSIGLKYNWY